MTQTLTWYSPIELLPDPNKQIIFKTNKTYSLNRIHIGKYVPVLYPHQYRNPRDFDRWETNLIHDDIRVSSVIEWAYI